MANFSAFVGRLVVTDAGFGEALVPRPFFLTRFAVCLLFSLFHAKAAQKVPPVTVEQVRRLAAPRNSDPSSGAVLGLVRLHGIVTTASGWKNSFFMQDATGGISVDLEDQSELAPRAEAGSEVEVTGAVHPGLFAPVILAKRVQLLGKKELPAPSTPSDAKMAKGLMDSQRIELSGVVRRARIVTIWGRQVLVLDLHTADRAISVHVLDFAKGSFSQLVDADVRVTGVCGTIFNSRRQMTGLRLFVPALSDVQVETPAGDAFQLPQTAIGQLNTFDANASLDHRMRVTGIVTYQTPSGSIFLQSMDGSVVRLEKVEGKAQAPGTKLDAVGFASSTAATPTLEDAVIRIIGHGEGIAPVRIAAGDAIRLSEGFAFAPYEGRLVQMEGEVSGQLSTTGSVWLIRQGNTVFQAELAGPGGQRLTIAPQTRVRLTGICLAEFDDNRNPRAFRIMLRSESDVIVLQTSSWSYSHLLILTVALILFSGGLIIAILQRRTIGPSEEPGRANSPPAGARYLRAARWMGGLVFGIALLALLALSSNVHIMREHMAGNHSITAGGVLALLASGAALWLGGGRRRTAAKICGGAACVISALSILAYAQGWDWNAHAIRSIDPENSSGNPRTGEAITAGVGLAIWSGAFCAMFWRRFVKAGQTLALLPLALALVNLICYLYRIQKVEGSAAVLALGPVTAACLLLLSLGALFTHANRGWMAVISAAGPGGAMARQMLPAAVIVPGILGWIRWQGQFSGLYDAAFGLALLVSANAIAFSCLIWSSSAVLNRFDEARLRSRRELELSEAALQKRNQQLALVFDDGNVGDWTFDIAADEICAHATVWRMYGEPTRSGCAPTSWFREHWHPDDREVMVAAAKDALEGNQALDVELRVVWADGSEHWLAFRGTVVKDSQGKPVQMHGLNIDITPRRHAEDALRKSEREWRMLADAMPQIVWTARPDGEVEYFNERWYEFSGDAPGEGSLASWATFLHEDDFNSVLELWNKALEGGTMFESQYRLWDRHRESYCWYLGRGVPSFDETGKITQWFGTCTDVDETRRVQEEIRVLNGDLERRVQERSAQLFESEQRLQLMIRGIKDYAICMLTAEGRIATWNIGAERLTGYTDADTLGKHVSMFYPGEDVQEGRLQRVLASALEQGEFQEEAVRVRKDGSLIWESVLITPTYDESGELRGFSEIARDITEVKRVTKALYEASHQAENANRAKSEFLAIMSHEIRTPMNGVIGMTELLLQTQLSSEQQDYVETIRSSGGALLAIINDVLEYSKIEAGKIVLERRAFNPWSVIDESLEIVAPMAHRKHLELCASMDESLPTALIGDSAKVRQILLNLLSNALKFTELGEVVVSVSHEALPDAASILLSFRIRDTGIGISPEAQARLFQSFTQADSSTTRRFGGTGLGLAISKRLTELMGGEIGLDSVPGAGSTFWFKIPFDISLEAVALPAAAENLRDRRVLAVDDNGTNRSILKHQLSKIGMLVTCVSSGEEALEELDRAAAQGSPYELGILDFHMPVMNGLMLAKEIRQRHLIGSTPLMMLTSDQDRETIEASRALGIEIFLLKPVKRAQLIKAIGEMFGAASDERQPVSPAKSHKLHARILVVDDNETNLKLTVIRLRKLGCSVEVANNGYEAVKAAASTSFDAILMDCQMPVMDGFEATAEIRKNGKAHVPIIALTANAMDGDRQRCLEAGMDDYLSKPITTAELLTKLQLWAGSKMEEPGIAVAEPKMKADSDIRDALNHFIASVEEEGIERVEIYPLLESLLETSAVLMNDIRAAWEKKDAGALALAAHTLKGSFGSFGLIALAQMTSQLEIAANETRWDGVEEKVDLAMAAYLKTRGLIQETLGANIA